MGIDWKEQFAEDRHRFPDKSVVVIRLPGDMNDGKRGVVTHACSPRMRCLDIDGRKIGLRWHYCIAALRKPM